MDSVAAICCKCFSGWTLWNLFNAGSFCKCKLSTPFKTSNKCFLKTAFKLIACHQQRYCCKQGRTLLSSAAVRYQLRFGQDKHLWAFGCYLLLLYLYSSAVGGRHSNEFPACSNTQSLAASYFQTLDAKVLFKNKSCLRQWAVLCPQKKAWQQQKPFKIKLHKICVSSP